MVLALFMGGFIAIGSELFQMWKSTAWNGLDSAFRHSMLALVTLVVVQLSGMPGVPQQDVGGGTRTFSPLSTVMRCRVTSPSASGSRVEQLRRQRSDEQVPAQPIELVVGHADTTQISLR